MGDRAVNEVTIRVCADTADINAAIDKINRLMSLLKEAKSLADEVASKCSEIDLKIKI